ncbi:MAG: hypothetical protein R2851_21045 [Caldilineaceae bacterium]
MPADVYAGLELFPTLPSFGLDEVAYAHFARQGDGFNDVFVREQGNIAPVCGSAWRAQASNPGRWPCPTPVAARDRPTARPCPWRSSPAPKDRTSPNASAAARNCSTPRPGAERGRRLPIPATSVEDVNFNGTTVRIYSEGGFTTDTAALGNYQFCTTDEYLGMPLIGLARTTCPSPKARPGRSA